MRARRVWLAPVAALVMALGAGLLAGATGVRPENLVSEALPNAVLALTLPWLGALVLTRQPRHRLGRLWLACGTLAGAVLLVHVYARLAVTVEPGRWPLATAAAWTAGWLWVWGLTPLMTLGLLLYPDGRLPGPRWRPAIAVSAGAVLLPFVGNALAPGRLDGLPLDNPLGVSALGSFTAGARVAGQLLFTAGVVVGAAALFARWHRGGPVARQKLLLPAWASGLLGATFLVEVLGSPSPVLDGLAVAEFGLLLAALTAGVLRDEAVSAGPLVRRSFVYGLLTGSLAAAFSLSAAVLARVLPVDSATLVAAVVTAFVALPMRERLEGVVNRALYGDRDDPIAALAHLDDKLAAAADPAAALAAAADAVQASLRLSLVQVQTGDDARQQDAHAGAVRLPLLHRGQLVGTLVAAPRAGTSRLDDADLRLLGALQRQAAAVVASLRLSAELQRSREHLVTSQEEERRRLRRDLHDGLGPTLAGIGLGLQVAATTDDPVEVRRLIQELTEEASAAVVDVRRLVEDLRPPALDELGLVGALRRHTDRLSTRGTGCEVRVHAEGGLDALPAAVEVAAYRIAMEALNNALRHARPRHCLLSVRMDRGLEVEVTDDGFGLPDHVREGVGIPAMRERAAELGGTCTVTSSRTGGTTVLARLPTGVA